MPAIEPSALSAEQRALAEHARRMMDGLRTPFTSTDENGALIGPFPAMLRFPGLARPCPAPAGVVHDRHERQRARDARARSSNPFHRVTVTSGAHGLQERGEASAQIPWNSSSVSVSLTPTG
ncbi:MULTISPECIES: hypothetical protein [unclassified Streptomyces]|uniref:hypothetical protein n=1 Tax=unclassified Streptomyces TaxID=2593676 RepID=UPI003654F188